LRKPASHDFLKKAIKFFSGLCGGQIKTAFSTADERGLSQIKINLRESAEKNRLADFTFSV
jgi:hypothetical protein